MKLVLVIFLTISTYVVFIDSGSPRKCYTCHAETEDPEDDCLRGNIENLTLVVCGSKKKFVCEHFAYEVSRCRNSSVYNVTRACNELRGKFDCDAKSTEAQKINNDKGYVSILDCYTCKKDGCNTGTTITPELFEFHYVLYVLGIILSLR